MDFTGQTASRVVRVGTTHDGHVQLRLDGLVIEMTPHNFRYFVEYLQAALPYTEELIHAPPQMKLRLIVNEDC